MRSWLLFVPLTAALAAPPTVPRVRTPDRFVQVPVAAADPTATPDRRWWTILQDAQLNGLLERAAKANHDVRIAAGRVAEARAAVRTRRSELLPSLTQTDSANRIRGGFSQGIIRVGNPGEQPRGGSVVSPFETNSFQLGLESRWELDLFGRLRKNVRAAVFDEQAAEEARHGVIVSVLADVARTYVGLRGTQLQLAIAARNVAVQRDTLELTRIRAEAGLASQLDVERQAAQLATTEATVPALEAARVRAVQRIGVLLGEPPQALTTELDAAAPLPAAPATLPVGVPADLLRRRPDVREAEAQVLAAGSRLQAARAELWPSLSLSGQVGRLATALAGLSLGGGNFFAIGPALQIPLFTGGRIRAGIAAEDARLNQATIRFEQTVLVALEEVENALVNYGKERERQVRLRAAVTASEDAAGLARELYTRGLGDFLTVLDAQRTQYAAESALAESDTAAVTQIVALYQALGGGWE